MSTIILLGILTWYREPYVNCPLRCGGTYDAAYYGIAVDIDALKDWRCGDIIEVRVGTDRLRVPVRDSGPLMRYCVQGPNGCTQIVGDLPWHLFVWDGPLSVKATLVNVSRAQRLGERATAYGGW